MLTELREQTDVYTKSFEPDVRIRNDNTVDQLREILHNKENAVLLALPAFHREQRIFGKVEGQKRDSFLKNATFDISSFEQVPNAEETALVAFNALKQIEFILHWDLIDNSPYPIKEWEDPETAISRRERIIANTVWRNFNPNNIRPQDDLAVNLIRLVMGNMRHLFHRGLDDHEAEPMALQPEDGSFSKKVRRLGSPSAEAVYIMKEDLATFHSLVSQTSPLLSRYLNGTTIDELSRQENKSEELILQILKADAKTIYQPVLSNQITTIKDYTIPTESEKIVMFTRYGADLPMIMSVIDGLSTFEKKCILYYFGYIGNDLSQENWTAQRGISEQLLRNTIHKVFVSLDKYLPHPKPLGHSIREIVDSCANYQVTKSSRGWTLNESSRSLRIVELMKNYFSLGTFTENELRIITFINNYFREFHTIPSYFNVAEAVNLPKTTVDGLVTWLLKIDPSKDRFATKEHIIIQNTARHEAICWYRQRYNNPEMMLQLLLLTPLQKQTFLLSVTLEENYYRGPQQMSEALKPYTEDPDKIVEHIPDILVTCMKNINAKLSVAKFRDNLTSHFSANKPTANRIIQTYLDRINSKQTIGFGAAKKIAQELSVHEDTVNAVFAESSRPLKQK